MEDEAKARFMTQLFMLIFVLLFLWFIVSISIVINTIRKVHVQSKVGWNIQAQCAQQYLQIEAQRRLVYDQLNKDTGSFDAGARSLVWLFGCFAIGWLIALIFLFKSNNTMFYLLAIVLGIYYIIVWNRNAKSALFSYFAQKDCDVDVPLTNVRKLYTRQVLFLCLNAFIFALLLKMVSYYYEHTSDWSTFSAHVLEVLVNQKTTLWVSFICMMVVYGWIVLLTSSYEKLHRYALCPYPMEKNNLKNVVQAFIDNQPDAVPIMIESIQNNYFRKHQRHINMTKGNILDYIDYLMNNKGIEFSSLPESEELSDLRLALYAHRNEPINESTFKDFFKAAGVYFCINLLVIVYIAFHLAYRQNRVITSYSAIVGVMVMSMLLSVIAWFENAVYVS